MADSPQHKTAHVRPRSPFVTIYRWPITMATSITHRVTGVALAGGTLLLAWWLIAAATGPENYQPFLAAAANPLGQIVLFGFTWALSYHLLNGIRHLAWDLGYGFAVPTANKTGILVIVSSVFLAIGVFIYAYLAQHGTAP